MGGKVVVNGFLYTIQNNFGNRLGSHTSKKKRVQSQILYSTVCYMYIV